MCPHEFEPRGGRRLSHFLRGAARCSRRDGEAHGDRRVETATWGFDRGAVGVASRCHSVTSPRSPRRVRCMRLRPLSLLTAFLDSLRARRRMAPSRRPAATSANAKRPPLCARPRDASTERAASQIRRGGSPSRSIPPASGFTSPRRAAIASWRSTPTFGTGTRSFRSEHRAACLAGQNCSCGTQF